MEATHDKSPGRDLRSRGWLRAYTGPVLLATLMLGLYSTGRAAETQELRDRIRQRIEEAGVPPQITVGDELIHASFALPLFYERRGFRPIWVVATIGQQRIDELMRVLEKADAEGLRPEDYHLQRIRALSEKLRSTKKATQRANAGAAVDLEFLCTDAYLIYGAHVLTGRINPETIDPEWFASRREVDLAASLEDAVANNAIARSLAGLLPKPPEYRHLKSALAVYRRAMVEGGWKQIPAGSALKRDDVNSRVALIRRRLAFTGDLTTDTNVDDIRFDSVLNAAVLRFQTRHGLDADGVVGSATLEALNVSAGQRVQQIITNLERWRWLPQELGPRHLIVNIADFKLDVLESDQTVLSMPVIVGRSYRRTPVFSDRITYLVLNPFWHVPPGLAASDIIPQIRKNPDYLAQNDFEVFRGWGADAAPVDPGSVDWSKASGPNLLHRFRQKPGAKNALGRLKFMFPNQFNVYLHDTPARGLFAKAKRDFSSGCIRIAQPLELAEYLLADSTRWTRSQIESALNGAIDRTVRLPAGVPIHILYWTAWADEEGIVCFRHDLYDRDRPLWEALSEEPPTMEGGLR